jgi:hypothetical protein
MKEPMVLDKYDATDVGSHQVTSTPQFMLISDAALRKITIQPQTILCGMA